MKENAKEKNSVGRSKPKIRGDQPGWKEGAISGVTQKYVLLFWNGSAKTRNERTGIQSKRAKKQDRGC